MKKKFRGQTLAELLVVIAAIAILGAVAMARYETSHVRSKTAEARSVLATTSVGIESYYIDYGIYPYDGFNSINPQKYNFWYLPFNISTPVAYLSSAQITDPFRDTPATGVGIHWQSGDIRYRCVESTWGVQYDGLQGVVPSRSAFYDELMQDVGGWILNSVGPDRAYGPAGNVAPFVGAEAWPTGSGYPAHTVPYDPTNGTMSWGDIMRSHAASTGYDNAP